MAAVVALTGVLVPRAPARAQEGGPQVVRLAGEDRFATAVEVAESFSAGVERVFLATGLDFPDALAAGPVAGRQDYPVLLVEPDTIPAATAAALDRLAPADITVLGGTRAISSAVQRQARQFTSGEVDRLAGEDRYATAAAIVDEYVDGGGVPVAYVATGEGFADALTGGPAAIATDGPVLLVEQDRIPVPTRTTLERLRPQRIVVLGGTAAVSSAVEDALGGLTDGAVDRLSGQDRFATAAAVAAEVFPGTEATVYMTTGFAFPDALSGGVVAGMGGAPLVTVDPRCVPDVVLEQIQRMDPDTLVVLGGTTAVNEDAENLVACSELEPRATTVQPGLAAPWDVVFTPDGRTFLTERDRGRVLERDADQGLRQVITFPVDNTGEGGLLGLAASPTYAQDGWLYALYVSSSDQRVVRFRVDGSGMQNVVTGLPDGGPGHGNHFAGRIEFGPDGMLYVGIGDLGDRSAAQDRDRLEGKILRYTADGAVPEDNPFGNPVWAYGFRDPQGLTWDAQGRMYASEFGQNTQDEIDRVVAGGNYGWPIYEGNVPYEGGATPPDYRAPIHTAHPDDASWSGASVLVGGDIPDWEGDLFVAALRGQRLYRLDLDGSGNVVGSEQLLVDQYGRLRHATRAPDGSLWVLTSNCDGRGSCPTGSDDRIIRLGR